MAPVSPDKKSLSMLESPVGDVYRRYEKDAKAAHLKLMLDQSVFVLFGNVAAGLTVLIGSWHAVDAKVVVSWFVLMVGFNTFRTLAGRSFAPDSSAPDYVSRWEKRLLALTFVSGALWGSAGHLLYVPGNLAHDFFLAVPIIAMGAAAVTSHAYHKVAYPLFFVPAVTPLILNLVREPSVPAAMISAVTPLYFVMMYLLSLRIYRAARSAVLSGFTNEYFATHDYLTGIANRRAFQATLEKETNRASRTRKPVSLIVADVDDFKRCNDEYGHGVGDEVLKTVASIISHRLRKGIDVPARIGGEEFAVILPETSLNDACRVANDIRTMTHTDWPTDGAGVPSVTLSLGVACLRPDLDISPGGLVDRADQAMYRAKLAGKDRVVADRDEAADA